MQIFANTLSDSIFLSMALQITCSYRLVEGSVLWKEVST